MEYELSDADGRVLIEELPDGMRDIRVEPNSNVFIQKKRWKTSYSIDLIKVIFEVQGSKSLCDEIMRDEDAAYTQSDIFYSLLSYVDEQEFTGKRVLDFGCGGGASTMVLSRMFPGAKFVGVELDDRRLTVARSRAHFYRSENVEFKRSPSGDELPPDIGKFDYIFLSAVYEHLLPLERKAISKTLWEILKPGGMIFVNQTPYRFFPIETHTTGLPVINYLPDRAALFFSRKLAKKVSPQESWDRLLRRGIRGATVGEIMGNLATHADIGTPVLVRPSRLGIRNQSAIWYRSARDRMGKRFQGLGRAIVVAIDLILLMRTPIAPYLSLAIRKEGTLEVDQPTC